MDDVVLVECRDATTFVTLNRPQKLNAFDAALVDALLAAVQTASRDGTRLLVFRGAGKGFSGGFDFGGIDAQSDGDLVLRFIRVEQLLQAVWRAPFVTMALVHGPCFGASADLAAACVHRIATADAKFRMPGLQFGVVLGTRRLVHVIGRDAARSILTSSRVVTADEARRVGLVTEVLEQGEWETAVTRVAAEAAVLEPARLGRLMALSQPGDDDGDIAALVHSVSPPGLKERIKGYLASIKRS